MKKIFIRAALVLMGGLGSFASTAQLAETFEPRDEAISFNSIKPFLQSHCWYFPDMELNRAGWIPRIEGDAAMVSGPGTNSHQNTGIYSPILDIQGKIEVGFSYKFNAPVVQRRWINIYLADHNNEKVQLLDSIELTGRSNNVIYTYNNSFKQLPVGGFKIFIRYQGNGGATRIAIDEVAISSKLLYPDGCNQAPVATNDNFTGTVTRSANGTTRLNDYDPDGEELNCYLVDDSPDGKVTINEDGTFTFFPNPGFTGSTTKFTYQICDKGFAPLCSTPATAIITFPNAGMLPVKLIDLIASIDGEKKVSIRWTTTFEQSSDRFEIERSFDGSVYEKVGQIKSAVNSSVKRDYEYVDHLKSSVTNKKDVYYRIRMVDMNNRSEISRVLVIRVFKTPSLKMVSVSPNPTKNDINVQVQLKENSFIIMKVKGNNGSELMRKSIRGNEGLNIFTLDGTSKLSPGIYFLEVIINSNERMTTKLIKG